MAKVLPDSVLAKVRGAIGEGFVVKVAHGQVYITRKAEKKSRGWTGRASGTPRQKEWRLTFHYAAGFAKATKSNPATLAYYQALAKQHGMRLRDICISDYFSQPKIESVDVSGYTGKPGGKIRFKAYERYPLREVRIYLSGPNETREEGLANGRGKSWSYTATKLMPPGKVNIHISAQDHANQLVSQHIAWEPKA